MRRLFWIGVSSYCYARGLMLSRELDRQGLKHTDAPCVRCALDPWEERRVAALRKVPK